jgi:hypothetical protein
MQLVAQAPLTHRKPVAQGVTGWTQVPAPSHAPTGRWPCASTEHPATPHGSPAWVRHALPSLAHTARVPHATSVQDCAQQMALVPLLMHAPLAHSPLPPHAWPLALRQAPAAQVYPGAQVELLPGHDVAHVLPEQT